MVTARKPRSNGAPKNNDKSVDGSAGGRAPCPHLSCLPVSMSIPGVPGRINHSKGAGEGGGGREGEGEGGGRVILPTYAIDHR